MLWRSMLPLGVWKREDVLPPALQGVEPLLAPTQFGVETRPLCGEKVHDTGIEE